MYPPMLSITAVKSDILRWMSSVSSVWNKVVIISLLRKKNMNDRLDIFYEAHLKFTFRWHQWKRRKTHFFSLKGFRVLCLYVHECLCETVRMLYIPLNPMRHKAQPCDPLSSFEIYQPVKALLSPALYTFHKRGIHGGSWHYLSTSHALCLCKKQTQGRRIWNRIRQKHSMII